MRALAKVGVIVICVVGPLGTQLPFVNLLAWPVVGLCAIPIAWYALFTLPAERAEQYEVLRGAVLGSDTRRIS